MMKKDEGQACQTPKEDLMTNALKHYDEASSAIHCWYSDIPKAIEHYYSMDQVKARDEEEAKELLKENGTSHPDKVVLDDLVGAMEMMKGMRSYGSDKPNEEIGGLVKAMGVLRGFDTKSFDEAMKREMPDEEIKDNQTSTWGIKYPTGSGPIFSTTYRGCCEGSLEGCDCGNKQDINPEPNNPYPDKGYEPVAKPVFIGRMGLATPDEDYFDLLDQFTEELPAYTVVFVYNDSNETVFEIVK